MEPVYAHLSKTLQSKIQIRKLDAFINITTEEIINDFSTQIKSNNNISVILWQSIL